uniref:Uncharacterized protein n=1 Tax=Arundo donax TaxID=35708 RepID=A0A0A9HEB7_ARUDO
MNELSAQKMKKKERSETNRACRSCFHSVTLPAISPPVVKCSVGPTVQRRWTGQNCSVPGG